jgi:hypothetical protein
MAAELKKKKYIYHHGPKHIPIICHLPDPPSFSLPTTFKYIILRLNLYSYCTRREVETLILSAYADLLGFQYMYMYCFIK